MFQPVVKENVALRCPKETLNSAQNFLAFNRSDLHATIPVTFTENSSHGKIK